VRCPADGRGFAPIVLSLTAWFPPTLRPSGTSILGRSHRCGRLSWRGLDRESFARNKLPKRFSRGHMGNTLRGLARGRVDGRREPQRIADSRAAPFRLAVLFRASSGTVTHPGWSQHCAGAWRILHPLGLVGPVGRTVSSIGRLGRRHHRAIGRAGHGLGVPAGDAARSRNLDLECVRHARSARRHRPRSDVRERFTVAADSRRRWIGSSAGIAVGAHSERAGSILFDCTRHHLRAVAGTKRSPCRGSNSSRSLGVESKVTGIAFQGPNVCKGKD